MTSIYESRIDCYNHLKKHIKDFIEVFVLYYGENKRQEIEQAFSRVIWMAYISPEDLKTNLYLYYLEVTNDISSQYDYLIPQGLTKEDLYNRNSFQYTNTVPIISYYEFLKKYEKDPTSSKSLFGRIKGLLLNPNITLDNFKDYRDTEEAIALNDYASKVPEMLEEYKKRISIYSDKEEEANFCEELKRKLSRKYYLRLINDNLDLLDKEGFEELKKYTEDQKYYPEFNKGLRTLFGTSINSSHPIMAFSKENDEKLNSDKTRESDKESIREERIKFFKARGIDLGEKYEDYLGNEEVKKIWPSYERVEAFKKSRNKNLNDFNIEYRTAIPSFKRNRQEIEGYHLINNDLYNASIYSSHSPAAVKTNIVKTEDGYQLMSILAVNCSNIGMIDHFIVHELNHLFELYLSSVSLPKIVSICGWDIIEEDVTEREQIDTLHCEHKTRPYEMFSELIDEIIAQDISQLMIDHNVYVFDTKGKKTIKGASYTTLFFLIRDFFKEFKDDIIESRHNGQINIIWNRVGKENFDALNSLIKECVDYYGNEVPLGYILRDKNSGINSPIVDKFNELIDKRDKILERMKSYSSSDTKK